MQLHENKIRLKVLDGNGQTRMASPAASRASLVYTSAYQPGDQILLECDAPGCFCFVQFEDTLPYSLIYLAEKESRYFIPFGDNRVVFSPKSFVGDRHLIRARLALSQEAGTRRNLAFNPYDQRGRNGFFPHAEANVETRGEAVFAAYNAIDGIYENASHGQWPYQSWGINRDPNAQWKISFGRRVTVDEVRLVLRADFPHDSYWTQATVAFSDGSREVLPLVKTAEPQCFAIAPRSVEWITLGDLIKADDPSPFPALTQFEAWGQG